MTSKKDDDPDVLKILVATDVHLGYAENDPLRARDSVDTFEEILQISQDQNVDFILLGGDLFHENKPSRWVMVECVRLLRQFCLSSKPVNFEFLSDPSVNFGHSRFPHPNYQDENLNVGSPIFTINGNHDDVTGRNLCALDVLHEAGLINYFGKYTSVEKIEISPLLLRKNNTRLALFGLGAVRDERLHRMFLQNQVKFLTLADKKSAQDDWFNLLVLHQNRVKHGATNYIPEKMLPDFFDLVVWGHEHPCYIDPTPSSENEFFVMQPGSSVATSLSEGEAGDKYVAVLKICGKNFFTQKIKLKTVRPFYFETVDLAQVGVFQNTADALSKLEMLCKEKVEGYLKKAELEHSGSSRQPKEPLIRLSIHLWPGVEEIFNVLRFGQQFVGRLANPRDVILFHRSKLTNDRNISDTDRDVAQKVTQENASLSSRVEDYVVKYFGSVPDDKQMVVLTERGLAEALRHFVDKEEKEAIVALYKHQVERCKERLKREKMENLNEEEICKILREIHQLRIKRDQTSLDEDQRDIEDALKEAVSTKFSSTGGSRFSTASDVVDDSEDDAVTNGTSLTTAMNFDDDDDAFASTLTPRAAARGRGVRGGRRASSSTSATRKAGGLTRGSSGRARGRASKKSSAATASLKDFLM